MHYFVSCPCTNLCCIARHSRGRSAAPTIMNFFLSVCVAGLVTCALVASVSVAFAQNTPDVPDGVLPPDQFHLKEPPAVDAWGIGAEKK